MISPKSLRTSRRPRTPSGLAIVLLVVLTSSCGDGASMADADNDVTTTSAPSAASRGELAYFAPDPLPDGARVMTAMISDGPAADLGGSVAVIGHPDGDGYTGVLRVLVTPAADGEDPSTYDGLSKVDVAGLDGYALDSPVMGSYVSWIDASWQANVVGPAGTGDLVLSVARSVELADDGAARLTQLPEEYVEIASFTSAGGQPSPSWTLAVEPAGGTSSLLSVNGSLVPQGAPASVFAVGDSLGATSVRNRDAVTAERSIRYAGQNSDTVFRSLAWLERPDLAITITASGTSAEDLVAFAESLHEIDETTFRALQPDRSDPSTPPTTSGL